jgi:hypothetical protein
VNDDGSPAQQRDARAERRDRRKRAERERMRKHGARTGETYRNAILKRLRDNAGASKRRTSKRGRS